MTQKALTAYKALYTIRDAMREAGIQLFSEYSHILECAGVDTELIRQEITDLELPILQEEQRQLKDQVIITKMEVIELLYENKQDTLDMEAELVDQGYVPDTPVFFKSGKVLRTFKKIIGSQK